MSQQAQKPPPREKDSSSDEVSTTDPDTSEIASSDADDTDATDSSATDSPAEKVSNAQIKTPSRRTSKNPSPNRRQSEAMAGSSSEDSVKDTAVASPEPASRRAVRKSTNESRADKRSSPVVSRPRQSRSREKPEKDSEESSEQDEPSRKAPQSSRTSPAGGSSNFDPATRKTRQSRGPTDPRDLEKGHYDRPKEERSNGGWCSCSSCDGCGQCWGDVTDWWSWLRRRSAFIVAFVAALGMTAVGLTGIIDFWIFASVNGKDLGGIGYCEGCVISPLYEIEIGNRNASFIQSTRLLSILLLLSSGVGIITLLFLIYLTLSAQAGTGDFQPPYRRFLWCSRFSLAGWKPTERELRQACADNGIHERWKDIRDLTEEQKRVMLNDSRRKTCFQRFMFWFFWPVGAVLTGLAWFWTDTVEADEKLGFELSIWGGMVMLVLYLVSVNIYRPTIEGATRRKMSRGFHRAEEEARLLKSRAAAAGKHIEACAKDVRDGAAEMGDNLRRGIRGNPRRTVPN